MELPLGSFPGWLLKSGPCQSLCMRSDHCGQNTISGWRTSLPRTSLIFWFSRTREWENHPICEDWSTHCLRGYHYEKNGISYQIMPYQMLDWAELKLDSQIWLGLSIQIGSGIWIDLIGVLLWNSFWLVSEGSMFLIIVYLVKFWWTMWNCLRWKIQDIHGVCLFQLLCLRKEVRELHLGSSCQTQSC